MLFRTRCKNNVKILYLTISIFLQKLSKGRKIHKNIKKIPIYETFYEPMDGFERPPEAK